MFNVSMKNFAEKIKSLVSSERECPQPSGTPFDFIRSRKGISKELMVSMRTGKLLGVYIRAFGEGMFLTSVKRIDSSGEEIIFNRYDMSGKILHRTVSVDEIQMVCPFNRIYQNPIFS